MKFFKINLRIPKIKSTKPIKGSTIIWGVLLTAVGTLTVSQLLHAAPQSREVLSPIELRDKALEDTAEASPDNTAVGEITITLYGTTPSPDIRILQNGAAVAYFSAESVSIMAQNNALIEIDGTKVSEPFIVSVTGSADTVSFADDRMSAQVEGNIAELARVYVRE